MNDPHVVSLKYRLQTHDDAVLYVNPPAVEHETDSSRLRLDDRRLTVWPKDHHATVGSARACVEPYLKSWEISAGLRFGPGALVFVFDPPAEVIDRNPPPPTPGPRVQAATAHLVIGPVTCTGVAQILVRSYPVPPPPNKFAASADVQTMWFRYGLYREGKEPLLSMAYACLTLLEGSTGARGKRRDAVCRMYNIDQQVRKTLGDIVSQRGGPGEARKFGAEATRTPLSGAERQWVEEAVKALIRRKAEYDADPTASLPPITMGQFVPL